MEEDEYIQAQRELDEATRKLRGQGKKQESPAESPFCAFCGKSKDKVKVLVAGPSVYICDECVLIARGIVDKIMQSEE